MNQKTNWWDEFDLLVRKGEFSYYPGEGLKELNRDNLFNWIESLLKQQNQELTGVRVRRSKYTNKFKQEAVRRVRSGESTRSVAKDMGTTAQSVSNWSKNLDKSNLRKKTAELKSGAIYELKLDDGCVVINNKVWVEKGLIRYIKEMFKEL